MNKIITEDDRPSIIQEIVFYDKPNSKAIVPKSILPDSATVPLGKGDIVISRLRLSSLPETSTELHNDDAYSDEKQVKKHPAKSLQKHKQVELESKTFSSIDSLNHFISYEILEEDTLESVDIKQRPSGSAKSSVAGKALPDHSPKSKKQSTELNSTSREYAKKKVSTEATESKHHISKVDKYSTKVSKVAPVLDKVSPFKTPKRPVEKKLTDYFSRKSKDGNQSPGGSTKKNTGAKATKDSTAEKAIEDKIAQRTSKSSDKSAKSQEKGSQASSKTSIDAKNPSSLKKTGTEPRRSGGTREQSTDGSIKETMEKMPKKSAKHTEKVDQVSSQNSTVAKVSVKKTEMEPRRSRGRPRKTSGGGNQSVKPEDHYSDEDVTFRTPGKTKNYTELTNVAIDGTQEFVETSTGLEDLLDEAQQHVRALDRVEEDLQLMFKPGPEEEKQTAKGKQKAGKRKPTAPLLLVKKVKREVEEVEEEESSTDQIDKSVVVEDDDDSEEDSRGEWMPSEYAEYRQQHLMKNQNKRFPCKFCGQQFSSYYGMRKHRALEHNDVGKDRKEEHYKESVKCKREKEQEDSDEESRDEWMPQEYADYKIKHKMNKMKRVQWYKCKICCAVFSNYYKLSKHRIEHENKPNPYKCKHCDQQFKDVDTLMAHIRVHQGKDPYQCRKCEKGFVNKAQLDEHIPVHILKKGPAPLKRFRCDICSKEFVKLCDIERHTRVHTGEKPSECNICHKRFQQSHNLSKHLLTHLHVKPFQCEICNKKFGRIDVLNRHLLTHSMEKPFKCQICSKGFIRQIQLTNHVEKMHTTSDRGLVVANNGDNFDESQDDNPDEEDVELEEGVEEVVVM